MSSAIKVANRIANFGRPRRNFQQRTSSRACRSSILSDGTTISEFEALSQAIWPGNSCTFGTIPFRISPRPRRNTLANLDTHTCGLALERAQHQLTVFGEIESGPIHIRQRMKDQGREIRRVRDQIAFTGEQS